MSILPENSLGLRSIEEFSQDKDKATEYLKSAFDNVYKYHKQDCELAQGRTNFQLEKFALLETYTPETAYESVLKSRKQMGEGLLTLLLDLAGEVRSFEYRWKDKDKNEPIFWEEAAPAGGSGKKLLWFDLDEMRLVHRLKSAELEVRDRLYQMEHLEKMLLKLREQLGGDLSRERFLEAEHKYWEIRFAEQSADEILSRETGISIGNIHSMRRASAPSLVDDRNQLKEGYLPITKMLESPQGRMEFLGDLQRKIAEGYENVMDIDLGTGRFIPAAERNKLRQQKEQGQISGSPENSNITEE
jgi:hypothetical protein